MRGSPLRQRRADSPVSVRSGASAMSERDVLQTALMVNTDGQMTVLADEDTFQDIPVTQQSPRWGEYPADWTFQQCPITKGRSRAYRRLKGMYGTTVAAVQGYSGDRHELALVVNSGSDRWHAVYPPGHRPQHKHHRSRECADV
eukprot:1975514-Pyramimonas_sp.AAC.1